MEDRMNTTEKLFAEGITFEQFCADMQCHRQELLDHYHRLALPPDEAVALADLAAVVGSVKALVITEEWCIDSVLNLPILSRVFAAMPGASLRIVTRSSCWDLAKKYPGRDGRSHIPTIVFLNAAGEEIGYWSERCDAADAWFQTFLLKDPIPDLVFKDNQPAPELKAWMLRRYAAEREVFYQGLWLEVVKELKDVLSNALPAQTAKCQQSQLRARL